MKNSAVLSLAIDARRGNLPKAIIFGLALSVVLPMLLTESTDEILAYLLVAAACAVPVVAWIQNGALGIPILPPLCVMYFIYYAVPILRKNTALPHFEPSEILGGAETVALFIVASTVSWWLLLAGSDGLRRRSTPDLISGLQLRRLMFFGFALGAFFHIAVYSGWLMWLGPSFGVLRSAMLTIATVACFILGYLRARGLLRGQIWVLAVAGMMIIITLSWASLYLIGGMIYCMAAVVGYVLTSRRVPWFFVSATIVPLLIFHAGKDDMRTKYWPVRNGNNGMEMSLPKLPAFMAEWAGAGFTTIVYGESYTSVIDRASLLAVLLNVQRLTPDYIQPLEGKSYAMLPEMLIPRFMDPDKIAGQAALNMLNVSYGFQTAGGTQSTQIAWGLIPEAYANFAYLGVIGVGLLLGLLCGSLERWSAGAPLISLPGLVVVTAMVKIIDIELDASSLITTLLQSTVSIGVFFGIFGLIARQKPRLRRRADAQVPD